ncbi:ubiquitin--protein ligase, partial [Ostertagia ostertagi]
FRLIFPSQFPAAPPLCRFYPALFHPNIDVCGFLKVSSLQSGWDESLGSLLAIMNAIQNILSKPRLEEDVANEAAATLYRSSRENYYNRVRREARRCSTFDTLDALNGEHTEQTQFMPPPLPPQVYRQVCGHSLEPGLDCPRQAQRQKGPEFVQQGDPTRLGTAARIGSKRGRPRKTAEETIVMRRGPKQTCTAQHYHEIFNELRSNKADSLKLEDVEGCLNSGETTQKRKTVTERCRRSEQWDATTPGGPHRLTDGMPLMVNVESPEPVRFK